MHCSGRWRKRRVHWFGSGVAICLVANASLAVEVPTVQGDPATGYRLLTTKAYLPPDFDQQAFDEVWNVWPTPLKQAAANSDAQTRRKMAFERYGLSERVDFATGEPDGSGKPLQYVVGEDGQWSMNCFACHGGSVMGRVYPGAPNNRFAFELLAKDIRASKVRLGKPLSKIDVGSLIMPLGKTRGNTNAVMFGVGLMHYRDEELNVVRGKFPPAMTHHDMDAPPWWYFAKRPSLYIDGFAEKGHRGLMQFMMVEENDSETLKGWDEDFRHVFAYLGSRTPPKYPFAIDERLAKDGRKLFNDRCAECHGTYAPPNDDPTRNEIGELQQYEYPNLRVPIAEVGTDAVRLTAIPTTGRQLYANSWFGDYGEQDTEISPDGYVAPPLDGVWASGPYFHNGSVPTLWHVLNSDSRPQRWQHVVNVDGQLDENFDREKIGIAYIDLSNQDADRTLGKQEVFDTSVFGKSNDGHRFPSALNAAEKRAVLEYLKTL